MISENIKEETLVHFFNWCDLFNKMLKLTTKKKILSEFIMEKIKIYKLDEQINDLYVKLPDLE